ncbi:uncharacterized protein METZ01_LOCUS304881 [marine metagenome]|uniref:Rho termination factor N-terminal domain-containing protein n=1 Tax=marine metagenome TaxID=408172 RepID=A0A382MW58_9ZZZZ
MLGWLKKLLNIDVLTEASKSLPKHSVDELKLLSKEDLEKHGRKFGIEIDRRFNKGQLIKEVLKAQRRCS